jgi:hypothetical protein
MNFLFSARFPAAHIYYRRWFYIGLVVDIKKLKVRRIRILKLKGPGDVAVKSSGHNSWVVGDKPCIIINFTCMNDFTKNV